MFLIFEERENWKTSFYWNIILLSFWGTQVQTSPVERIWTSNLCLFCCKFAEFAVAHKVKIRNFQIWEFVRSVKFRLKQWFLPVSRSVTAKQALDLPNFCFWTGFWTKPNDYFYENLNSLFRLKVLQICLKLCCVSYLRSLNGYEGAKLQNRHFWSLFIRNIDFVFHGNSEFQVSFDTASDLSQTAFVEGFVFIYRAASSKLPKRALFRLYWSKIDLAYF